MLCHSSVFKASNTRHRAARTTPRFAIVQFSRRAIRRAQSTEAQAGFAIVQFSRRAIPAAPQQTLLALLPKLQLLWNPFRGYLFCRRSFYRIHSFPLCASHEKRTHRSFWRHIQFQSPQMSLLSCKRDTRPRIHRELNHVITIIQEKLAKLSRILSLLFCPDRQVKAHHQPTHFEFLRIHGLYSDSFPLISALLKLLMTNSKTASKDNSSF